MQFSHLGVQFTLTVGLLFFGGFKLDDAWGTSPLFLLVGLAAGFAIGLYHLMRAVALLGSNRGGKPQGDDRDRGGGAALGPQGPGPRGPEADAPGRGPQPGTSSSSGSTGR